MKSLAEAAKKAGRFLSMGVCAALALALVCLSLAVLVQALALLVLTALAGALFLHRPLSWYAGQGAEALRVFVDRLFAPPAAEKRPEKEDSFRQEQAE